MNNELHIEWVVVTVPVTTVKWNDGTTTWVELRKEDAFSEDAGILLAIAKKFLSYTEISNAIEMGKASLRNSGKVE